MTAFEPEELDSSVGDRIKFTNRPMRGSFEGFVVDIGKYEGETYFLVSWDDFVATGSVLWSDPGLEWLT